MHRGRPCSAAEVITHAQSAATVTAVRAVVGLESGSVPPCDARRNTRCSRGREPVRRRTATAPAPATTSDVAGVRCRVAISITMVVQLVQLSTWRPRGAVRSCTHCSKSAAPYPASPGPVWTRGPRRAGALPSGRRLDLALARKLLFFFKKLSMHRDSQTAIQIF